MLRVSHVRDEDRVPGAGVVGREKVDHVRPEHGSHGIRLDRLGGVPVASARRVSGNAVPKAAGAGRNVV